MTPPKLLARRKPSSKQITVLYHPDGRPPEGAPWRALIFIPEHEERYHSMNMQTGSMSGAKVRFVKDCIRVPHEWEEEFKLLKAKTVRVMDDQTAQGVQAAYVAMMAAIEQARAAYQAVLDQAWHAARPLRQQDVDPTMRDAEADNG